MSNTRRWLLLPALGALLLLGLLVSGVIAQDPVPPFPHEFYGALTVGGEDAAAGMVVSADGVGVVPDTEHNPIVTDEAGFYGEPDVISPERLHVLGSQETIAEPLMFYVNGVQAETGTSCQGIPDTFCYDPGEITELALDVPAYTMTVTAEGCAPIDVVYTPTVATVGAGGMMTATVFSETQVFAGIAADTVVELSADDSDPCCGFDWWLVDGTETVTATESITVAMDGDRSVEMMSSARARLEADFQQPSAGELLPVGEMFTVTAQIANTCTAGDALSVTAELTATEGISVTDPIADLGPLAGGEAMTTTWTALAETVGEAMLTVFPDGFDAQTGMPIADANLISSTVAVTIAEADIEVSPMALDVTLLPDETASRTVTISNTGDVDLVVSDITENPAADWLMVSPISGTVAPEGNMDVTVDFDATGLMPEVYTTTLTIMSNDPDEAEVDVDVTLTVEEEVFKLFLPVMFRNYDAP